MRQHETRKRWGEKTVPDTQNNRLYTTHDQYVECDLEVDISEIRERRDGLRKNRWDRRRTDWLDWRLLKQAERCRGYWTAFRHVLRGCYISHWRRGREMVTADNYQILSFVHLSAPFQYLSYVWSMVNLPDGTGSCILYISTFSSQNLLYGIEDNSSDLMVQV